MSRRRREIAAPFVAAAPEGAGTRTRLRVSEHDAQVLRETGMFLGHLAGRDLAERCAEGNLAPEDQAKSRARRKRDLTTECSSRQAGTITRVSEDQYQTGRRNQLRRKNTMQARIRKIEARAQMPCGEKRGETRGYATPHERHQKLMKVHRIKADLARLEADLAAGHVSVVRGGRDLLHQRGNLEAAGRTREDWRQDWEARRMLLSADGDAAKPWGNATITWNPDEEWLEVNLPKPLATWRTGPAVGTDCPARSPSPTSARNWQPRPPPDPSTTT